MKEHESYRGDRTQASLTTFADNLVPSAGQPHHYIRCSAVLPGGITCLLIAQGGSLISVTPADLSIWRAGLAPLL